MDSDRPAFKQSLLLCRGWDADHKRNANIGDHGIVRRDGQGQLTNISVGPYTYTVTVYNSLTLPTPNPASWAPRT